MKALVAFYSLEGNTRLIANMISKIAKTDILELKPKKQLNSKSFFKYIWGGKQIVMNEKPELEDYKVDCGKYDLIFIGTPVWVSTYAPAIKTFISANDLGKKDIALFCCYGGTPGRTFNELKKTLSKNKIISTISFKDPLHLEKKSIEDQLNKWLNRIGF